VRKRAQRPLPGKKSRASVVGELYDLVALARELRIDVFAVIGP
jgi:hypothetical protein